MHHQSLLPVIINLIEQVQHIIEAQAQGVPQELTELRLQQNRTIVQVLRPEVAEALIKAVAVVEVAVHHFPEEVQVDHVVLEALVDREVQADHVLHQVEDN